MLVLEAKTEQQVLDTRAAAAYLGLARQTLARLRVEGTGPRFVKAGRVLYRREELNRWLMSRERVSTSDAAA